jgi:hypothetical protein
MGLPSKQDLFSGCTSNGYSVSLLCAVFVKPTVTATEMGLPSKQDLFSGCTSNGYSVSLLCAVFVKPTVTEKPQSEPNLGTQVKCPSEKLVK